MCKKKILIVDDQPDVRFVLEQILTAEAYACLTANNGCDALALANVHYPDLIILDILMPHENGDRIAAQLKDCPKTKDIPIIFLTCLYSKTEELEKGRACGGNLIFAKPFEPEELLASIRFKLKQGRTIAS